VWVLACLAVYAYQYFLILYVNDGRSKQNTISVNNVLDNVIGPPINVNVNQYVDILSFF
jgi:hypothetical protein